MRVAVIVVSMLAVATPSEASKSCMSKTEARQHFGAVHIYWHGADHCWDASPTSQRHQIIHSRRKAPIYVIQQIGDQAKWHDSMSKMLADDEPEVPTSFDVGRSNEHAVAGAAFISRWIDIEPSNHPPLDARWVDIPQVMPSSVIERRLPPISLHVVLLVLITITITLTLAIIELVFRMAKNRDHEAAGNLTRLVRECRSAIILVTKASGLTPEDHARPLSALG